jgi:hypothetical protein
MSQSITEVPVVAPVVEKKLKVPRKSKKMMMTEVPVIPEKIEMDLPQSAGGSSTQQAIQMSQVNTVVKRTIKVPRKVQEKKEEVPVVVVQEVAELLAEMVESAYQEELKQKKKEVALAKAKATREANKLKKKQEEEERLAREAEETETEDEDEDEDENEEYEVSTSTRPIQKEKEGRVLEGRIEAVEGVVKKELKVLKTKVSEVIANLKDEKKIEEKKNELANKKQEATRKLHHAIAEKFKVQVVVARRSEAGKGEKKNFASKGVELKDKTTRKLFWANCERVLPHFVENFTTYASAKKEYKNIENWCFADETAEAFSVEKQQEAENKFYAIFQRATEALVSHSCDLMKELKGESNNTTAKLVFASHLSVQGIYVVKRVENKREVPLVLRNSRDELIEIGNANEVMSVVDLVHHSKNKVLCLGNTILQTLCGAVATKKVAPAPAPVKKAKKVKFVAVKEEEEEFLVDYCE